MKWPGIINAEEVKRAIATLQPEGDVFEIRVIGTAKKDILSGYFRDAETLLAAFDTIDLRQRNVYVTLGKVKEECFSRAQSERFLKSPQTTSDTEIERYRWLFIDFDPVRSAGISSSDDELRKAEELAGEARAYLQEMGFEEPVYALSGNGYHLFYRIDLPNNDQERLLVEGCLKALAERFNTDDVKIDTTNSNPSRICKLHGTLAQKGRSTKDRPHRMSRILSAPENILVTPKEFLQELAGARPEPKPTVPAAAPRQDFNLLDFMSRHGMTYEESSTSRARVFRLDECPFDASHKDGDAKIFWYPDGAIAFKCHHNSCRQYKWQDVREKFEPGVYDNSPDDERYDQGYKQHVEQAAKEAQAEPQRTKRQPKIRKLKTAVDLLTKNLPDPKVYVGNGADLPFLVEGTCILSAKPKLGKSWLALCMCLAIAQGKDFLGYKTQKCSTLYLDLETSETLQQRRILKVLKGAPVPPNFYIESETNRLDDGFVEQIEAYLKEDPKIGVVVIDVFPIIRTESKNKQETEYAHAYRDITPLNTLALKHHISIILVCHDRKAVDPDDPFANILGSTGLQGAVSQMISMYRKTKKDPIHISVKGKTIDGMPELSVSFEDAVWSVVDEDPESEQQRLQDEYQQSTIREAVLEIVNGEPGWKGRAGALREEAVMWGIPIMESPKEIGGFLHRHISRFLQDDNVVIKIVKNGTGAKTYEFSKYTVDDR